MGDERMFFKNDSKLGIKRNDQNKENKERHIARYKFASNFIKENHIVLDCACGSGYGSKILSKKVKKVIGIDNDHKTILFARKHYTKENIEFIEKDLFHIDFSNEFFDIIVSLETLEHVENCIPFLQKIKTMLKKGGVAILSTPMLRYKDGNSFITNPFHLNELPREKFLKITKNIFDGKCEYYAQYQTKFQKLTIENTGFCIAVCKK